MYSTGCSNWPSGRCRNSSSNGCVRECSACSARDLRSTSATSTASSRAAPLSSVHTATSTVYNNESSQLKITSNSFVIWNISAFCVVGCVFDFNPKQTLVMNIGVCYVWVLRIYKKVFKQNKYITCWADPELNDKRTFRNLLNTDCLIFRGTVRAY